MELINYAFVNKTDREIRNNLKQNSNIIRSYIIKYNRFVINNHNLIGYDFFFKNKKLRYFEKGNINNIAYVLCFYSLFDFDTIVNLLEKKIFYFDDFKQNLKLNKKIMLIKNFKIKINIKNFNY